MGDAVVHGQTCMALAVGEVIRRSYGRGEVLSTAVAAPRILHSAVCAPAQCSLLHRVADGGPIVVSLAAVVWVRCCYLLRNESPGWSHVCSVQWQIGVDGQLLRQLGRPRKGL
jgi:hypothetical protein